MIQEDLNSLRDIYMEDNENCIITKAFSFYCYILTSRFFGPTLYVSGIKPMLPKNFEYLVILNDFITTKIHKKQYTILDLNIHSKFSVSIELLLLYFNESVKKREEYKSTAKYSFAPRHNFSNVGLWIKSLKLDEFCKNKFLKNITTSVESKSNATDYIFNIECFKYIIRQLWYFIPLCIRRGLLLVKEIQIHFWHQMID